MKRKIITLLRRLGGANKNTAELSEPYMRRLRVPGLHEQKISAYFGADKLEFTGAAPEFDRPLIILGFTNRSGSNLLAEYLRQPGQVFGLGEFTNHDFVQETSATLALETYPDLIRHFAQKCGPNQVFGLKASWDQIAMLARWNIPAMFKGVRIIHISRDDMLEQAISMNIALQTRQWTHAQKPSGRFSGFDGHRLEQTLQIQHQEDVLIRVLAQAMDVPRFGLTYEALCADPTAITRKALSFCGKPPKPDWVAQAPKLQKQAGGLNKELRAVYLAQVRKSILPGSSS